ncbi:Chromosome partition protein Smc [Poriferisphaera corsica]|uniref:Chromosome partition protein Smc n=1 Tax=Poriferisphaera corsica TaxID=2528020 RepID=A0A517YSJ9_9BACT|nr:hypothetical protein [Poriferisphaera corsica]QDU33210.1 Chromosome partition protein Smc [Poriferisphaera corsica]
MNLLTKVFVVVVALLSVLLVALTVSFVANTENYKEKANEYKGEKLAAQNRVTILQDEVAKLNTEKAADAIAISNENAELKATIVQLRGTLATEQMNGQKLEADLASMKASVDRMSATGKLNVTLLEKVNGELNVSRGKLVGTEQKLAEALDKINELKTENEGVIRQLYQNKEQVVALKGELDKLNGGIATLSDEQKSMIFAAMEGTAKVVSEVQIAGEIVQVVEDSGVTLVQLNVGQSDGVKENMEFIVHRGADYLGTIVVSKVDASQAAGQLTEANGAITVGDNVMSGIN